MWRTAACTIAAGGIVIFILFSLPRIWKTGSSHAESLDVLLGLWRINKSDRTMACNGVWFIWFLVVNVWIMVVGLVRAYLFVEAFISIRDLPAGAYNATSWVNVLPHIG